MSKLDNNELIRGFDVNHQLDKLYALPEQMERLYLLSKKSRNKFTKEFDNIYIFGDSDGIIAGSLLQSLLTYEVGVPIVVEQNGVLPGFLNKKSLAIAIFGANPNQALLGNIKICIDKEISLICITKDDQKFHRVNNSEAQTLYVPIDYYEYFENHYIFLVVLPLLERNLLIGDYYHYFEEMVNVLRHLRRNYFSDMPFNNNPAKKLAASLNNSMMFIYCSHAHSDSTGKRWAHLLKKIGVFSTCLTFPDALYNEPFLYLHDISLEKKIFCLVDRDDDYRILKKFDELKSIALTRNVEVKELFSTGESKLSKMLSWNYLIDYANHYLYLLKTAKKEVDELN